MSLSLGVYFDCFGIFKPSSYAEIALKQGASGEKSIEKERKTAIEKFAKELCALGFCNGVALKQTNMVLVKEKGEKKGANHKTANEYLRGSPWVVVTA